MEKIPDLAPRQAQRAQKSADIPSGRRHQRRWNYEKCIPLVILAWILGAIAFMPLWLYLVSWYWAR